MKRIPLSLFTALLLPLLLAGCLEIDQYPAWRNGAYDGKPDNLPSQANYHGDRLAWNAQINDRNHLQNEYVRTRDGAPRR
ncbi:MAG TPA: hypothetical protein VIG66_11490 [Noviherbaspirillum sp.]